MADQCPYPAVDNAGMCCEHNPCDLEWYRPCDRVGGCWERSTCAGCDEPVWPGPSNLFWTQPAEPRMIPRRDG